MFEVLPWWCGRYAGPGLAVEYGTGRIGPANIANSETFRVKRMPLKETIRVLFAVPRALE